jgi:hypothetical protein
MGQNHFAQWSGFTVGPSSGGIGPTVFMSNEQTYNNAGLGISSTANFNLAGRTTYLDNDKLGEVHITLPSADVGFLTDAIIAFATDAVSYRYLIGFCCFITLDLPRASRRGVDQLSRS